ncbi:hypothetical protein [Mucilaginibacter celer]|uniref:Uncharacterized protein n=1 Tax=Mucilaginibacter celer TaxID=2305508 RepID=A0A494VMG3_9SPHI|nr:hypothetical protein [Mucilaginibacter celer]AYL96497.1 hypothetical protein HYN43_014840 [Mucilaginibacter celer]
MSNPFPDAYFETLKGMVLKKAGLNFTETSALKSIITAQTGHQLSLYALNKAFGLAPARFKPSPYTLDVLALFCGYEGWDHFCRV